MSDILKFDLPENISRLDVFFEKLGARIVMQVWRRGDAPRGALIDVQDPDREFTFSIIRDDGEAFYPTSFREEESTDGNEDLARGNG